MRALVGPWLGLSLVLAACSGGAGGPPPAPGGPPAAPTVERFEATRSVVDTGTATTLVAVFANGTGAVDHGVGTVESGVAFGTGTLAGSRTYTLTVTGSDGATVTAQVTVTVVAPPSIDSFAPASSVVTAGTGTTLTARFANGTARIDPAIGPVADGQLVPTGALGATQTFTLTVTNAAGTVARAEATVTVVAAPRIETFTAARPVVTRDTATSLTAVFSGGEGVVDGGVGAIASGVTVSTGALGATQTFTLTVTNAAGTVARAEATVTVVAAPVITRFDAAQPRIVPGAATTLTAVFAGGTGRIDPGGMGVISGQTATTGPLWASRTFTLTVTNAAGTTATAEAAVTVAYEPPTITSFVAARPVVGRGEWTTLRAVFANGGGRIDPDVGIVASGYDASTPVLLETTTYTLTVTSASGEKATARTTVQVVGYPAIQRFESRPSVSSPGATELVFEFTDGSGTIDQGVGPVTSGGSVVVRPGETTAYTLTVANPLYGVTARTIVPRTRAFDLGGGVILEVLQIPPGAFVMGGAARAYGTKVYDQPKHNVTITDSYDLGRFEVTQAQWLAVVGTNPSWFSAANGEIEDLSRPVESVSWNEVTGPGGFLDRLNAMTTGSRPAGLVFRLPTEAEWENAARAGSVDIYYWPWGAADASYAWYYNSSSRTTHAVGQKIPNAYGLFDLSGNVWEFCADWYGPYTADAQTDPTGPIWGNDRVARGGSWASGPEEIRLASRNFGVHPDFVSALDGFRVVLARPLPPPAQKTFTLPGGVRLEVTPVAEGAFAMGSRDVESGHNAAEAPQHDVELRHAFYAGTYEITQAQWLALMSRNPSYFSVAGGGAAVDDLARPVERVSWSDVTGPDGFLARLNAATAGARPAGLVFRLPTEAEVEYLLRGGTSTRFPWGDDPALAGAGDHAWYAANAGGATRPVGQKPPNPFGLHDVSGNVREWCQDWGGAYAAGAAVDPAGPRLGTARCVRGGSWREDALALRSAARESGAPAAGADDLGLRVVLALPREPGSLSFVLPAGMVLELNPIPAGTFVMGSPDTELGRETFESPQHQVTLSRDFHMGKFEVTQGQWLALVGENFSYFTPAIGEIEDLFRPIDSVSYDDIVGPGGFLDLLDAWTAETRPPGTEFRLPTEAEWEYAARAGTTTRFYWGEDLDGSQVGSYAWNWDNSSDEATHAVGELAPNAWGLHDMSGNLWEVVQDGYEPYTSASATDPTGPADRSSPVHRGGGWDVESHGLRSAQREAYGGRDLRYFSFGFRVVLAPSAGDTAAAKAAYVGQTRPARTALNLSPTRTAPAKERAGCSTGGSGGAGALFLALLALARRGWRCARRDGPAHHRARRISPSS